MFNGEFKIRGFIYLTMIIIITEMFKTLESLFETLV